MVGREDRKSQPFKNFEPNPLAIRTGALSD